MNDYNFFRHRRRERVRHSESFARTTGASFAQRRWHPTRQSLPGKFKIQILFSDEFIIHSCKLFS